MVQVLFPIIQRFICIFVRYPEGNIFIYRGEQAMPLSYISLGRHLEGNVVIYDLHYDYLLILIFIWSSGFFLVILCCQFRIFDGLYF